MEEGEREGGGGGPEDDWAYCPMIVASRVCLLTQPVLRSVNLLFALARRMLCVEEVVSGRSDCADLSEYARFP
jgi:hypothetical protein